MPEEPPWYDLAAFGAKTGLGRTMVWQLRREGKIRVVRVGRGVFVPASELERFVSAVEADAGSTVTTPSTECVGTHESAEASAVRKPRGRDP
jgi:hypothetical protein